MVEDEGFRRRSRFFGPLGRTLRDILGGFVCGRVFPLGFDRRRLLNCGSGLGWSGRRSGLGLFGRRIFGVLLSCRVFGGRESPGGPYGSFDECLFSIRLESSLRGDQIGAIIATSTRRGSNSGAQVGQRSTWSAKSQSPHVSPKDKD